MTAPHTARPVCLAPLNTDVLACSRPNQRGKKPRLRGHGTERNAANTIEAQDEHEKVNRLLFYMSPHSFSPISFQPGTAASNASMALARAARRVRTSASSHAIVQVVLFLQHCRLASIFLGSWRRRVDPRWSVSSLLCVRSAAARPEPMRPPPSPFHTGTLHEEETLAPCARRNRFPPCLVVLPPPPEAPFPCLLGQHAPGQQNGSSSGYARAQAWTLRGQGEDRKGEEQPYPDGTFTGMRCLCLLLPAVRPSLACACARRTPHRHWFLQAALCRQLIAVSNRSRHIGSWIRQLFVAHCAVCSPFRRSPFASLCCAPRHGTDRLARALARSLCLVSA
jgi:hypothetical protein